MSLTKNDLLVLGLLLDRSMHGYEINQYVETEGITTWFNISTPAIYYSLNKLRRQGFIFEMISQGGGAKKSVYHPTEKGREQFFAGMEEALSSEEPVLLEYDLGIFLLNKLPHDRALALLEKRMDFLQRRSSKLDKTLERERMTGEQPLKIAILDHAAACARMETQWLDGIIRHLHGEEVEGEEYHGLMLLTGDLHDFHLPDLIKLIASGRHSGTLAVTDGASTRTLSFHEGRPVCATSRQPNGEARDSDQVINDVYDLFRWQEGSFTFDQRMEPQEKCTVLHISTEELILIGSRWVDNWAAIQQVVPSSNTVFEHRDGWSRPDNLNLTEEERRVLDMLDGTKEVSTVARACELTEFETSKILYGLAAVGLVQPGDLGKIRLRRVFRELAELMCRGTVPYRDSPDDVACEIAVNQQCTALPIRLVAGRIEDQTDPNLRTEELAEVYRTFLQAQRQVVRDSFGEEVAERLHRQVLSQVNPDLREALEQYELV